MKTTSNAFYSGKRSDQIQDCMSSPLKNFLNEGIMKNIWEAIKSESDIQDLIYFYMAKRRESLGCIGESMAQDCLDYIVSNRDKKIHDLGEIYK